MALRQNAPARRLQVGCALSKLADVAYLRPFIRAGSINGPADMTTWPFRRFVKSPTRKHWKLYRGETQGTVGHPRASSAMIGGKPDGMRTRVLQVAGNSVTAAR